MPAATTPPKMRSSMAASRVCGPAGVETDQGEEPNPKREIDDVQHGARS